MTPNIRPQIYVCASHTLQEIYFMTIVKSRMARFRQKWEKKTSIFPKVDFFSVDITTDWAAKHKEFWNAK